MSEQGAAGRGYWDESNEALVAIIRDRIADEGRITFTTFMGLALPHPQYGHYRTDAVRARTAGGLPTATAAHSILGHAIARRLAAMGRQLDRPEPSTLREYGAGAGTLALAILDGLRTDGDDLLTALRDEPVEINPVREAELAERLDAAGFA